MPATFVDKVLLFPIIGLILAKTLLAAVTGPFRSKKGAPTYFEHVYVTMVRCLLSYCSIEQIQWILPPFTDAYKSWCKKNKVTPDIVDIPGTKAKGFWVGSKSTAKYTLVWYHGGGFMAPGSTEHIDLALRMVKWSDNKLAVFFVAYTLSPGARYPVAIGESVEGLRYILDLPGHSPETTLIGGDSAGGALVFAILSHLSHPHPQKDIVKPLHIGSNLNGAIAIAPWASSDREKYPSIDKYGYRDTVNYGNAMYWSKAYKGGAPDDEYIYSALAIPSWWKNVKINHVLVTAGEEEVLVDTNKHLAERFKHGAGGDKLKLVIGEREVHDAPLMAIPESKLEELGEKKQEGAIRLWIKKELR